ncbi:MAG TPA: hypothetical protein VHI52_07685, partial [Verrucomicrobiae bacterium]|nr:hypothetical protein [Verrucomicrobiae bacterium]
LDPLVSTPSNQALVGTVQTSGGQQYLTLTVNRAARAPDVTYVVEVSSDLKTWVSGAPNTVTLSDTDTQLVVRDGTPIGLSGRAIRLAVTSP